jgi:hypothetical protein
LKVYTYLEASTKVLVDMDMQDESFVEPDELVNYFNEAIQDAASEIRKLNLEEDYFETDTPIELVEGQSQYDLPSDILNRDFRRIVYHNGSTVYPVRRFRGKFKFERMMISQELGDSGQDYRYNLKRPSTTSQAKLILFPPARETSSEVMTAFYIRNARRIPLIADGDETTTNETEIDIPEHINFIFAYVKYKISEKSKEDLELRLANLQSERQLMIDTLSGFADDDDEIEPDLSHYMESN